MRVKRGNVARQRRKKFLKLAKGFRASSSKLFRPARQAVLNALRHAYKDRRLKKEILGHCGLQEPTQQSLRMVCLTPFLWEH